METSTNLTSIIISFFAPFLPFPYTIRSFPSSLISPISSELNYVSLLEYKAINYVRYGNYCGVQST
jgi:hypothetical protein